MTLPVVTIFGWDGGAPSDQLSGVMKGKLSASGCKCVCFNTVHKD